MRNNYTSVKRFQVYIESQYKVSEHKTELVNEVHITPRDTLHRLMIEQRTTFNVATLAFDSIILHQRHRRLTGRQFNLQAAHRGDAVVPLSGLQLQVLAVSALLFRSSGILGLHTFTRPPPAQDSSVLSSKQLSTENCSKRGVSQSVIV